MSFSLDVNIPEGCPCCRCVDPPHDDGARVEIALTEEEFQTIIAGGRWDVRYAYPIAEEGNYDGGALHESGSGMLGGLELHHYVEMPECEATDFWDITIIEDHVLDPPEGHPPYTSSTGATCDFRVSVGRVNGAPMLLLHLRISENLCSFAGAATNGRGTVTSATVLGHSIPMLPGWSSSLTSTDGYSCSNALSVVIDFTSTP